MHPKGPNSSTSINTTNKWLTDPSGCRDPKNSSFGTELSVSTAATALMPRITVDSFQMHARAVRNRQRQQQQQQLEQDEADHHHHQQQQESDEASRRRRKTLNARLNNNHSPLEASFPYKLQLQQQYPQQQPHQQHSHYHFQRFELLHPCHQSSPIPEQQFCLNTNMDELHKQDQQHNNTASLWRRRFSEIGPKRSPKLAPFALWDASSNQCELKYPESVYTPSSFETPPLPSSPESMFD